jgi:quinol monooxygenase YgiN
MIIVLAEVESSLESIETIRGALVDMEKSSRAESGCHDYTFSQEIGDPSRLRILELWESLAGTPPKSMSVKVHELGNQLELPS